MLTKLNSCSPLPSEIIVHVDAGDAKTGDYLSENFPSVKVIQSETTMGPGGGRNKLVQATSNNWVLSLDDDSWPQEKCFFELAAKQIERFECDLIACKIIERGDSDDGPELDYPSQVSWFVGCGCLIRKEAFEKAGGFIPLRYAYGMEESDLALKMIDHGYEIIYDPSLVVYHDCDREAHHSNPKINAAQISNIALLCFLRFPISMWYLGLIQVANRLWFCIRKKRFRGMFKGVLGIPALCFQKRSYRKPVQLKTLRRSRQLRDIGAQATLRTQTEKGISTSL